MAANSSNAVMIVNVRYNSTNSLPVEVDPKWNVGRLKEEISKIKNIPKSEVRIIFQGREIHDCLTIQQCDLGNNSVLHAVQARSEPLTLEAEIPTESLPQITTIPETYKSQFYVYCKDECNAVKPGKIRVRCKKCQSGAFEVHRDPEGWDDVLEPNQITGACLNKDHCDGNIAEFYFKCKEHDTGEKDTSAVLNLVRPNRNQVPCITCYNESNPIMVWPCNDQHCMCLDCFKDYGNTKLQERGFLHKGHVGYTLPCPGPAPECNESFVKEPHHFRVLGSDEYERYKNFATEEFVLQSGGVLCPGRNCGAPLMLEHTMRKIQCNCGHVFCRICKEPFHAGDCTAAAAAASVTETTYPVDPGRANRARYEQASRDEVEKIAIPCPKCQVPTERSGGCMHMTCSRCKFNWCWLCKTEWSRQCQGNHWFGTGE